MHQTAIRNVGVQFLIRVIDVGSHKVELVDQRGLVGAHIHWFDGRTDKPAKVVTSRFGDKFHHADVDAGVRQAGNHGGSHARFHGSYRTDPHEVLVVA